MPGPLASPASQRARRNRTTTAATLEAPAATRVDLPVRYSRIRCVACALGSWDHNRDGFEKNEVPLHEFDPVVIQWRPLTVKWWATIWDSPIANEWVDADVPGLLVLASLVDEFWTTGDPKVAAEMRMQQREYGLSPFSRRQLQWEIKRLAATKVPAAAVVPPTRRRGQPGVFAVFTGGKKTGTGG